LILSPGVSNAGLKSNAADAAGRVFMQKRQVTLEDGRYLIFYTFEDAPPPAAEEKRGAAEPQVEPEAEEERSV
jgi:hypothetical protein